MIEPGNPKGYLPYYLVSIASKSSNEEAKTRMIRSARVKPNNFQVLDLQ